MNARFAWTSIVCVLLVLWLAMGSLAAAEPAKAPREGYKPPDFTLNDLSGKPVTLSKLLEKSSVVLVVLRGYPGYQCPICMVQVGDLLKHAKALGEANAHVVLVYPGPAEALDERGAEFLKNRTLPEHFSFVMDRDYAFTNAYGLRWDAPKETAYPSTFVIDRQGTIRLARISKTHGDRAKTAEIIAALPGAD
jgi:peroxiredoxin